MAELIEAGVPMGEPEVTRVQEVIGNIRPEHLEGAFHPGAGRDSSLSGSAQVRIVEVHQPIGRSPHLTTLTQLLPL
jgi:hypothetical protein